MAGHHACEQAVGSARADSDHASEIVQLSSRILRDTKELSEYLESKQLPQPTSRADGPTRILPVDAPPEIHQARQGILAAAIKIHGLIAGPSDFLPELAVNFGFLPCLAWLCHYRVFQNIPLEAEISYRDLAGAVSVPEARLKSIVRTMITAGVFTEYSRSSSVAHSATSRFLATDEDAFAYACWLCERTAPMAMAMTEAHKRWGPDSTAITQSAYNAAFNTNMAFFQDLQRDKSVTEGFAKYMRAVRSSDNISLRHLVNGFDWQGISKNGLVVDVGGSMGDSAVALAAAFSHLNFVVEDLAENVENGKTRVPKSQPADIAMRVQFHEHNFMHPQPIRGADVYLLRMILHDWPDGDAIKILTRQAEAMDMHKSRLVIMDTVLPTPGTVPVSAERIMRNRDLTMMQAFNARERELEDWIRLIACVTPSLKIVNVTHPVGSAMSLIEVGLST